MTQSKDNHSEINLPGYQLEKLIGSGGYGEVWLAQAPGGLTKAVKLIFGFHNEKRAASELRSLEKIKSVRHPFLLSLERIEVVDGRLVIVSELADGSLKDCFDSALRQGLPGIPREELLGYLRDSADALDFLCMKHSLQHLDVKPENLLLLAGHIKVADFGLVKRIQETQASLVGGMTPLYSAPEVFEGRPTIFSDQYSLAVLYQEMLTGKLPFCGTTAAELTLQHMHDEPDLSPLPMADRYIVARALSKKPEQRYKTCKDFVEALMQLAGGTDQASTDIWTNHSNNPFLSAAPAPVQTKEASPGSMTKVFEDDLTLDPIDVSESMLLDLPEEESYEQPESPVLHVQAKDFRPTPTLIIGVGGTGASVLKRFRKQLLQRFGKESSIPAVQLILLDTDKKAILEATHGEESSTLSSDETLALPLRRPQEYRDRTSRLFHWLSRRWLYNIPKSLQTEGLRPLGRLAFVDHVRRTVQRLRMALSHAMGDQEIEHSQQQTGLEFRREAVRVYVVASISGGTGSGMSLDLGYAVQGLLHKLGIENATTTGVFLHSTGRDSRYCDLSKVNAFAWLKEFHHYARPEGCYPGDETSGLLGVPAGSQPFDHTYFVPLGDGLTAEQLDASTDRVARYLYLDSLTAAQLYFDSCRENFSGVVAGSPVLRSFGLYEEEPVSPDMLNNFAQLVSRCVVLGWSGDRASNSSDNGSSNKVRESDQETSPISDTNQIICGAPRAVAQLQLGLEAISATTRGILEGKFGGDISAKLDQLLNEANTSPANAAQNFPFNVVDTLFAAPADTEQVRGTFVLGRKLDAVVSPLGLKLATDLQQWLLGRLDEEQDRLIGVRNASRWFTQHFARVKGDAERIALGIKQKIKFLVDNQIQKNTTTSRSLDSEEQLELATRYFRLRLDLCALQASIHLTNTLTASLVVVDEAIVEFGRHLRHIGESLSHQSKHEQADDPSANETASDNSVGHSLMACLNDLVAQVDQQLQLQFIHPHGGLFQTVMGNRKIKEELLVRLNGLSTQAISAAVRELCLSNHGGIDQATLERNAGQAISPLLRLGGVEGKLALIPQGDLTADQVMQVRESLGSTTSMVTGADGNLTICTEVGQLPLSRVAVDLIERRRDYAEFADRVHTRTDIKFTPLIYSQEPVAMNHTSSVTQQL